jgi:peptide methionine sulfoxide reductase MsrA
MHFENYIKTSSSNLLEDEETMRFLRHIYVKTENMQDLQALLSMYSIRFSNDEEIIRFENMGKWKEAEIYHMDNVAKNPHDLSACMSFLECLKKSGSYGEYIRTSLFASYINIE